MTTSDTASQIKGSRAQPTLGHNSGLDPDTTRIQSIDVDQLSIWGPADEQANDCDQMSLDEAIAAIGAGMQRTPVPIRLIANGYQAVGKGHLVRAAREHNLANLEKRAKLDVRVFRDLTDEGAFRALAQDVEQDYPVSSLARGRFFQSAMNEFGSVEKTAVACRVSKAAVSKNLDVARCLPVIGDKILVHRDIGQRDAAWLMTIVGREADGSDAPDAHNRALVITAIESFKIMTAAKVFAELRAVVKTTVKRPPRKGVHPIMIEGDDHGSVRAKKDGKLSIELVDTGAIPVEELMAHIGAIVARIRN